jgi:hypothetical protein
MDSAPFSTSAMNFKRSSTTRLSFQGIRRILRYIVLESNRSHLCRWTDLSLMSSGHTKRHPSRAAAENHVCVSHPQRDVPSRNTCTLLIEAWDVKRLGLDPADRRECPRNAAHKSAGEDMRLDGLAVMQLPAGSRAIRNEMSAGTGLIVASREPK